jgi:hypothetical protein
MRVVTSPKESLSVPRGLVAGVVVVAAAAEQEGAASNENREMKVALSMNSCAR